MLEKQPLIIGISGGSGSGKTSFIKQLEQALPKEDLCIVSQDDYYRPRDEMYIDRNGIKNFDLPTAIYREELHRDLLKLQQGEVVTRIEYTFNNEKATPKMLTFRPRPIIVIEGLFIFYFEEIFQMLDLSIFVEAKDNLKIIRRIKRDQIERNYPLEDVLYRYEHHVMPSYEKYILPFKEQADLIVNNNSSFNKGLQVTMGFLKDYVVSKVKK